VSVTKQMEFERELRDGERDINSSAACSVICIHCLMIVIHIILSLSMIYHNCVMGLGGEKNEWERG